MSKPIDEIRILRSLFNENTDPERAPAMSAYMKGLFPFLGISAPTRKLLVNQWIKETGIKSDPEKARAIIRSLYTEKEREYHYAAIDLLLVLPTKSLKENDDQLLEFLITQHSWWDSVDLIASHTMGKYLIRFPERTDQLISSWRNSENMWLNRSCLLFQLKYREKTNSELLFSLVDQYKSSKEFFIRKAIGWSLREYSKWGKEKVRAFVLASGIDGLAKREASKYL